MISESLECCHTRNIHNRSSDASINHLRGDHLGDNQHGTKIHRHRQIPSLNSGSEERLQNRYGSVVDEKIDFSRLLRRLLRGSRVGKIGDHRLATDLLPKTLKILIGPAEGNDLRIE